MEKDLDELFPVMALLEGRCVYEAARKAKLREVKRLEELHKKLEKYALAGDVERYFAENYRFQELVQ